jgi:hypothetical protein
MQNAVLRHDEMLSSHTTLSLSSPSSPGSSVSEVVAVAVAVVVVVVAASLGTAPTQVQP